MQKSAGIKNEGDKLGPNLTMTEAEVEQFYACGFSHYGSGQWKEATDLFRLLCTRRPFEPKFWFALAATLQEAGNYQDALSSWAMAALLKPEDPYPHFHAAECCFSLQMKADAEKALVEAHTRISKDPSHPLKSKIELLRQQWRL